MVALANACMFVCNSAQFSFSDGLWYSLNSFCSQLETNGVLYMLTTKVTVIDLF